MVSLPNAGRLADRGACPARPPADGRQQLSSARREAFPPEVERPRLPRSSARGRGLRVRPPKPVEGPASVRTAARHAVFSAGPRPFMRADRDGPSAAFPAASPKCPPAASASRPAMAMPRRERIGGAIANAGAEQGVERVRRSTSSVNRLYECDPDRTLSLSKRGMGFHVSGRKAERRGRDMERILKAKRRRLRLYRPRKAPEWLYF